MISQTFEDVGTLEKSTLRHPVTTKVTTGVQLPSPPLFELTSYGSRESIEVSEGLPSGL